MSLFPNIAPSVSRSAGMSRDGKYRYALDRHWDCEADPVVFAMLNPSTADDLIDDPTIKRCMRFARDWGHGGLVVVNLFALRATDPAELAKADDPIGGPDNDSQISRECAGRRVIVAWGAHAFARDRARHVMAMLTAKGCRVECLGLTKDGHPKHPVRLSANLTPVPFSMEAAR